MRDTYTNVKEKKILDFVPLRIREDSEIKKNSREPEGEEEGRVQQ